jgi:hypothetical protein
MNAAKRNEESRPKSFALLRVMQTEVVTAASRICAMIETPVIVENPKDAPTPVSRFAATG